VSGVSAPPATERAHEAERFAETVAAAVARHPTPDRWRPGAAVSDAVPELEAALAGAGWEELGDDPDLIGFVAPAAAALGSGFATLCPVDRLLGGALCVGGPAGRRLVRYAEGAGMLVTPRGGHLELAAAERLTPLPYADSMGVASVAEERPRDAVEGPVAERRVRAWIAASLGYLAGICEAALRLALEHTRARVAFGRPLAALEPVQQSLAGAATLVEGLTLLSADVPGADELAYAGDAAVRALADCQQLTGALGFTLEFPMQRAYRRVRASRAWSEAVLDAWEAP
jgi:3-oxo-4-pregnene-20-carboxyl-CoA dehydrogenase alpha subunit